MNKNSMTKSNFGGFGWYYIVLSIVLYYFAAGIAVDSLNVSVGAFSETRGWDYNLLLQYSTYGGYFSIVISALFGWLIAKKGTKKIMALGLFVSGAATIWWGYSSSQSQYLIACAITMAFSNGYSFIASSNLAAVWFPKKKGLFLGWSTMGLQLATIFFVVMLSLLLSKVGIGGAYAVIGALQLALGILVIITVKDTPEEAGKLPDNEPSQSGAPQESSAGQVIKISWKEIISKKETWFIGIAFGVLYMSSVALLSQWVPRLISHGIEMNRAIIMLSIASAIGLFGSYAWGWIDAKYSPKKASVGISFFYVVALAITVLPFSIPLLYISVLLIGLSIGGVPNLVASLTATIFGKDAFAKAFSVISVIYSAVRVSAFATLAIGLNAFGSYNGAYTIFLVLTVIATVLMVFIKEKPLYLNDSEADANLSGGSSATGAE